MTEHDAPLVRWAGLRGEELSVAQARALVDRMLPEVAHPRDGTWQVLDRTRQLGRR